MKHCLYIFVLLIGSVTVTMAQDRPGGRSGGQGSFSLSNLTAVQKDSILRADTAGMAARHLKISHLTPHLGDPYAAPIDSSRLNFANSTLVEGRSLSVGYLANQGSATQTRMFSERKEARDFMFVDAFDYWITTPTNANFYDVKIPYTNVLYTTDFASQNKTDRLKGVLTTNFGKKVNIGAEMDYIYSRGFYNSNGNKLYTYRIFGNYISDRYELRAYVSNYNFLYHENGGLTNDRYITHPDDITFTSGKRPADTRSYPVRYTDYFNRVRGKTYFLTQRYNLGFHRTLEEEDEEGNEKKVFVPVSSIIHTLDYEDNRRHAFASQANTVNIDTCYTYRYRPDSIPLDDRSEYWKLSNTIALSMREGFQDWAKFGLAAFVRFEKRQFSFPVYYDSIYVDNRQVPKPTEDNPMPYQPDYQKMQRQDEFTTYLGGSISKRQGSILTYNAQGELAVVGDDIGEFRLSGDLQTRFKLFKKDATIQAEGYIYNVTPSFYMRHNSSRYYQWDNDKFKKERRVYAGGTIDLASTRTRITAGVNNIQNYVYFNPSGVPQQDGDNIQVITVRLKQDFRIRAFGWENEVAYQLSGKKSVLPLPEITAYSNVYFDFKLAKVLSLQLGADVHYFTEYYAPYYEPGTLQFQVQDQSKGVKVGNFPLINAYANLHLKQARFFVTAYNLGSKFVSPNYFSLLHYPLDPMVIKAGIAVTFNN